MKFGAGQSVRRTEDIRFITGNGQYTDDLSFPRQAYAAFVRSPYAHAKINGIDSSAAKSAPGVVAVLTQADIVVAGGHNMPSHTPMKGRDGSAPKGVDKPLLAEAQVTFSGEAVAMVIAQTLAEARDAAELVAVDYEDLPAAGTLAAAPDAPAIFDGIANNESFDWVNGNEAATNAAFAAAAHTASIDVVQNRIVVNSMETRNAIGLYDSAADTYELYSGSQGAGGLRGRLAGTVGIVEDKLRVVTPDVGGGFGMKAGAYPEQALVLLAAKITGRPVRWSSDRTEAFLADQHGRDTWTRAEAALDKDGHILAVRVTGTANLGGYMTFFAPFIPTIAGGRILGGVYRVPNLFVNIKGYFTNTAPINAYRGAGRPEAAYMMERLMDAAAVASGIDRVELRKRNLLTPEELPYKNWYGIPFDSGNYPMMLEEGLRRAGMADFASRKAQSAARGRLRGFGFGYYVEITAAMGSEPAAVKFTGNGGVELYVGTQSNGQGHETAYAQLIAEKLGVPFESVTVKQGDTRWVNGGGTGGSRSLNMAGGALLQASDEVIKKGKAAAGQVLQAGGRDVTFEVVEAVGRFRVAESERSITLPELAVTLKREKIAGYEDGLDSDALFAGSASTFPNGCHVCEVEVDPETGKVDVVAYHVLDDFGRVINPMLVAGQVHGGVAQGVGQALLENCVYDPDSGQCLTASFSDYAMPRADDLPDIAFAYEEIPCKTHELGVKGCGEAGTVGAMPAVISAVCDAIGVVHLDMPATPERVWRALQEKAAA
ncbi:MAG: xanthine dehydrogenase family protein molybdopterin-binding subunit [Alphaproteobacteria bacterium]|nr:xanthine dehydrogenase family protein molybdopterin-binding subunit [Alphaproteobacteria bacterium]MBN9566180.1 xanthine dehydrogenase family protein molybdopterin-binding subunit [Alphaproteobacteria bacterium]